MNIKEQTEQLKATIQAELEAIKQQAFDLKVKEKKLQKALALIEKAE